MRPRIAILGIYHESNTFLAQKTCFEDFEQGHLCMGPEIYDEYKGAHHEIGGMLEILNSRNVEAVPLMFAEATPSGIITAEAFEQLQTMLFNELSKAGKLDGILIAAHGAAVSENYQDMDGYWFGQVRKWAGKELSLVATLDPHANVSQAMVKATNAMVAYKTNPHIDQRACGRAAANTIMDTIEGKIQPVQYLVQPPIAISIEQQHTDSYPCKPLYELSEQTAHVEGVLSSNIFLGFPYADVCDMGSSILVVTDQDEALARKLAEKLSKYLIDHREDFIGRKISIEEAIQQAKNTPKPVLMLDMGDNVGGGSPADSTFLLKALEKEESLFFFICLYDPEAVKLAQQSGLGSTLKLEVGAKSDHLHGKPYATEVKVEALEKGEFTEQEARHGGQQSFNMGDIAIVITAKGNTLMVTSRRIAPFSLKQLTTFGIMPESYDVLVAKGVQAPLAAYGPVFNTVIRVNTPGITHADMRALDYKHRRKPMFPFEDISDA